MQSIMFIAPVDLMDKSNGVTQKVINQYNAFCGSFDAYLAAFEAGNVVIYHHNNLEYRDGNKKIQRVIRLNKVDWFIKEHHIENLYIRYMLSLPPFIKLLHNVKKSTKKIAIEIPDYPYTPQLLIKRQYARFICDWLLNRILKCYVHKVFICSKDKELFGIEATQLINGTDVEKYKMRNILNTSTEYIEVLSLSIMGVATAVDRFLLGMKAYEEKSGKRKIRLHMVGNGDYFEKYCSIINELQLNDSVVIYGSIPNDQLLDVFSKCDIGLGAIGFHRAHIHNDSTLKV
ncbi:MAG: glycosyltransferase, partial [Anaerovoracaceae bacterium]